MSELESHCSGTLQGREILNTHVVFWGVRHLHELRSVCIRLTPTSITACSVLQIASLTAF